MTYRNEDPAEFRTQSLSATGEERHVTVCQLFHICFSRFFSIFFLIHFLFSFFQFAAQTEIENVLLKFSF